ncbi:Flagellar hook-length control protein [Stappia aggregata IAM 12614]|uniref:Flagellar hook-length control protein n=1 Tax=Roseibium aggregatum (strain ATCC 25650 / DSM 13394 / JCM 20685 / NBRC 16684 / NCIMB 2208 / IAM 12614 / B1) TaxID=384765 RepID=A0P3G9_ROSAI|nr:flagellar hook-length control protein FliK [Roseibium aggregatum]EAV40417.1 Flagellar hook-length control protein [Stappia aggregata IAM 12614] [Roseibium aggregatum IAM 12614]
MPADAGRDLGANVLPFGLTTDVSAGALAAGAGSALAGGQASAGSAAASSLEGKANGFADELNSIAGQGKEQAKTQASAAVTGKGGRTADQLVPGAVATQIQANMATGELAPAGAVDPAVPVADPAVSGDISAAAPLSGIAQPVKTGEDLLSSEGDDGVQSGEVALAADFAPATPIVQPVSQATGDNPAAASISANAGVSGEGGFGRGVPEAGVSGAGGAGTAAPGAAPSGSAPLSGNGSSTPLDGPANGTAPLPAADAGGKANTGAASAATAPNFTGAPADAEASATQPATPERPGAALGAEAQAAVSRPAAVTAERRWQSELPKELRASATPAVQPSSPQSSAAIGAAVDAAGKVASQKGAEAPGLQVAAATPAGTHAASVSAVAQAAATIEGSTAAAVPATLVVGGEAAQVAAVTAETGEAAPKAGSTTGAAASQVAATVNAGAAPVPQPVQPAAQPVLTDQPPAGETAAGEGAGLVKPAVEAEAGPQAAGAAKTAAAGPAANAADQTGPEPRGAASVAVSAAALSNIAFEETDLPADLPQTSISGEMGTATVRGGDLAGAMRTESLQAPSQSQSGHVATQVAAEIARNLKNGHTRFQMRFDPPELGRVEVEMKVSHDGKVQAHLRVDRPETLDMFLRDQRGLERALEAAGLNTDSDNLQFSLRQDGGQQFGSQQGEGDQGPAMNGGGGTVSAEADPMLEDIVRMTIAEQRGGLDMKV